MFQYELRDHHLAEHSCLHSIALYQLLYVFIEEKVRGCLQYSFEKVYNAIDEHVQLTHGPKTFSRLESFGSFFSCLL